MTFVSSLALARPASISCEMGGVDAAPSVVASEFRPPFLKR